MMLTADIRQTFLKFFERNGHKVVPSSPLIPHNDPSLLFTNSGMVQFKNYFTGQEKAPFATATTAQKCLRAGGKHNDLENVGYTARHHTFFEMLGNFSFGDYFKEEAISYAWTLLTKEFKLDPTKLYVTVYADDHEAAAIWKKITNFPDHKIISISTTDNFWSMGDTGPCGPCSEIFYDHGEHIPGGLPGTPDQDGDRFVEIWNLVFMQFEQHKDGSQTKLPRPCVDTGMGIERIAAILQGVHNNYDTDILKAIVEDVALKTGAPLTDQNLISERVIADHLRSSSFLIADGILPSNEGRGYVLRRIMRRAMRHAHLLGAKEPLMHKIVPVLLDKMGGAYPELNRAKDLIQSTLKLEEERFSETLSRGLKILSEEISKHEGSSTFSGHAAFKLYDTFGFPLDLTEDILKSHKMVVNHDEFLEAMEQQKALARTSWVGSGEENTDAAWFEVLEKHGPTDFLGYQTDFAEGSILELMKDGHFVGEVRENETAYLLTSQTPFYGESGGQLGDMGALKGPHGIALVVNTFKKAGKLYVHEIKVAEGMLRVNDPVQMLIDSDRRQKLRANHSATHLLHAALQIQLGTSVVQKGSLVAPDRFRFDFSYPQALGKAALMILEREVNAQIRKNSPVLTLISTPEEAIQGGAQALFGEKYGEEVRVVAIGEDDHTAYSKELCGGTHVARTGDIGFFKIIGESSVSAGVRRLEAVTGIGAEDYVAEIESIVYTSCDLLKSPLKQMLHRLMQVIEDKRKMEKEVDHLKKQSSLSVKGGEELYETKHGPLFHVKADGLSAKDLKPLMDTLKNRLKSGIVFLTSVNGSKVSALVGVTEDLLSALDARILIQSISHALESKGGGGRPDLAQCGGDKPELIPVALEVLKQF
ncbi:MAG: alanine--tRNA ligase [Alphaproteobacteria bacterium]